MSWYPTIVLYFGVFDAIAIMLGGLVTAFIILMGWDAKRLWERLWPALVALIGSNIAAALILSGTHMLIGSQ